MQVIMTSRGEPGSPTEATQPRYTRWQHTVSGTPQSWVSMVKKRHRGLFRPQQPGSGVSSLSEDTGVIYQTFTQESLLKGETGQWDHVS